MILHHKRIVLVLFVLAMLICGLLMSLVRINFRLADYLPSDAPSTTALQVMEDSFNEPIPNVTVMMEDLSLTEALAFKSEIASSSGVNSVLWLDDVMDIRKPLEMEDKETVEAWYKDGYALYRVSISKTDLTADTTALEQLVDGRGILTGDAMNQAEMQKTTLAEVPKILLFVLPLVLVVLLVSTSSWFEPLLFLITIGVAILLNEGTNIFLGEISFLTRSTSAVLQLAISMDYAVFLLHRFAQHRHAGVGVHQSMSRAMVESVSVVAASAATTVAGFLALVLMRFKLGPDMGLVLAKGILCSFISVMVLLPVLAVSTTRIMERLHHRSLLPSFNRFGKLVVKICVPIALVVLVLIVPGYLGQQSNTFIYGSSGINSKQESVLQDAEKVKSVFGSTQQLVLLVPEGQLAREAELVQALEQIDHMDSVLSYTNAVGLAIPDAFVEPDILGYFQSGGYNRIILQVRTTDEGDEAFRAVESIRAAADNHYPGQSHLLGQSPINYDLKETITSDNRVVSVAVLIAIGLVLLVTFRSFSIPLVLLLAIRGATWLNLSVPYFSGHSMNYIGYLIISSVQLGATVDYGILFVQQYLENRQTQDKREALRNTISGTSLSILTPATILALSGVILGAVSSNAMIGQLGIILGRGAALSAAVVLLALPGFLLIFDKAIRKTTWKNRFRKKVKS